METPQDATSSGEVEITKNYENLFIELKQTRLLSIELDRGATTGGGANEPSQNTMMTDRASNRNQQINSRLTTNQYGSASNANNQMQTVVDHFDGLILFNDLKYSKTSVVNDLKKRMMQQVLNLPIQSLSDQRAQVQNAKLNETFRRIHDNLCSSDDYLKACFDMVSSSINPPQITPHYRYLRYISFNYLHILVYG